MRHDPVKHEQRLTCEVVLNQAVSVSVREESSHFACAVTVSGGDAENGVVMRRAICNNGLRLLASQTSGIEHLHVRPVRSKLRIERVLRYDDMKRFFDAGNRGQDGGAVLFQQ